MNTVGKIFVGLICLMSVVFMTMAMMVYSTHINWKDEITRTGAQPGYQERLKQIRNENDSLRSQIDSLRALVTSERANNAAVRAGLQTELNTLANSFAAAKAELDEKTKALKVATTTVENLGENLAAATTRVAQLTAEVIESQKRGDDSFRRALALTDLNIAANLQLAELKPRLEQLTELLAKSRLVLQTLGYTVEDVALLKNPPPVESEVTALTKDNLVEFKLGSYDGIRKGHELDVYRGSKYLGRIQVIEVRPDEAVGQILRDYQTGQILKGDKVTSKLTVANLPKPSGG
ncbi:MAG: hypothetical protein SGJ20_13560 [Planctomycetota bacterium]|nr:hypothetical protein [Planctomycetota bacterium]